MTSSSSWSFTADIVGGTKNAKPLRHHIRGLTEPTPQTGVHRRPADSVAPSLGITSWGAFDALLMPSRPQDQHWPKRKARNHGPFHRVSDEIRTRDRRDHNPLTRCSGAVKPLFHGAFLVPGVVQLCSV